MSTDDKGRAPICPFCGVTLPGDAGHVLDPSFICENPDCDASAKSLRPAKIVRSVPSPVEDEVGAIPVPPRRQISRETHPPPARCSLSTRRETRCRAHPQQKSFHPCRSRGKGVEKLIHLEDVVTLQCDAELDGAKHRRHVLGRRRWWTHEAQLHNDAVHPSESFLHTLPAP